MNKPVWALPFAVAAVATALPARAAPRLPGYFSGAGTAASADLTIGPFSAQLTRLATAGCPCGGTNGHKVVQRIGPVSIPGLLSVSATFASALGDRTATEADATELSKLAGVSLLGGLVQAGAIQGVARIRATDAKFSTSYGGSHFSRLKIAGHAVPEKTPPNTVIPIPGVGNATIFSVTKTGDGTTTEAIDVVAVLITVTQSNSFGFPVGATIALGHASAGYNRTPTNHVVAGNAYVANTTVQALNLLPQFGDLGYSGIGDCAGTGGITHTNHVAALSVGGLTLGAATTTVNGRTNQHSGRAQTTANIAGVSLLGLIGASAITSEATETAIGQHVSYSTAGTTFAGLTVNGITLPTNVGPNTSELLPLLGYVIVNEQQVPAHGQPGQLTVNALHIYITTPNLFSIPVGTEIIIGHASAIAEPLTP